MRKLHRCIAVVVVLFAIYVAFTGTLLQSMDLKALLTHAPATDTTIQSLHEGISGPPNFQVLDDPDYSAAPLPAGFDYDAGLAKVLASDHAVADTAPIRFVEFRVRGGKPVAQINAKGLLLRFDAVSGKVLVGPDKARKAVYPKKNHPGPRSTLKDLHRFRWYSIWGIPFDLLFGLTVGVMLVSGLIVYFRLMAERFRKGRANPYWFAGGWWRTLHRVIAITSAAFLIVVVTTGILMSVGSMGNFIQEIFHQDRSGQTVDESSPLTDAQLPAMLHTTLTAYRAQNPDAPVKVLRLRYFAGMPQGVIITGDGEETRQLVFNAVTGVAASMTEPGYPYTGQSLGWQTDEILKSIHRGDIIGLTGRWMSLFTGLSALFLAISGVAMYLDLWNRRRRAGASSLFW